jgi:hypothetical protein
MTRSNGHRNDHPPSAPLGCCPAVTVNSAGAAWRNLQPSALSGVHRSVVTFQVCGRGRDRPCTNENCERQRLPRSPASPPSEPSWVQRVKGPAQPSGGPGYLRRRRAFGAFARTAPAKGTFPVRQRILALARPRHRGTGLCQAVPQKPPLQRDRSLHGRDLRLQWGMSGIRWEGCPPSRWYAPC